MSDIIDLGFRAEAPVLLPYTPKDEPLILGLSFRRLGRPRSPYFRATWDGITYTNPMLIQQLKEIGGYTSLVPNSNGFGVMYYDDGENHTTTDVFYREVDILKFLKTEIDYLSKDTDKQTVHTRITHSVNQSIPNSTMTKLLFDTTIDDATGLHDIENNRIVIKKSGVYSVTANMMFTGNANGFRIAQIRLNGTTTIARQTHGSITNQLSIQINTIYELKVGDFIEVEVYQNSGNDLNVERMSGNSAILSVAKF